MIKTRSEELFEDYCGRQQLAFQRLPTARNKSPDYRIDVSGLTVIVEVKQLDESEEDRARYAQVLKDRAPAHFDSTDDRVAEKLKTAANQLRVHSKEGYPTIVCICDLRRLGMLSADNIKVAMYGEETVVIDRSNPRYDVVSPVHPGRNRQCTPGSNTSISAVGLLSCHLQEISLNLFHNSFARVPLPPVCLAHVPAGQFRMDLACTPYEWQPMTPQQVRTYDSSFGPDAR